jgi:two-component system sensor histidine kinase/response regulator
LLTSMVGQLGDAERARQAGILNCLSKPVRQLELYNCLVKAVAHSSDASETVPSQTLNVVVPSNATRQSRRLVLLVEDHPINQEVALAMLESLNYQVKVVANGLEAVEAVARGNFDLVLMDCQMPEMDGFSATSEIRRTARANERRLPIIALTANAMQGDQEACLASGMDDYLSKPFDPDQLRAVLARWLPENTVAGDASDTSRKIAMDCGSTGVSDRVVSGVQGENFTAMRPTSRASPIDSEIIKTIAFLGKPSLLQKLITLFCDDAPKALESMREAAARNDSKALASAAHRLKSNSANLGALQLATLCRQIELLARNNRPEGISALVAEMDVEFRQVKLALETGSW